MIKSERKEPKKEKEKTLKEQVAEQSEQIVGLQAIIDEIILGGMEL